MVKTFQFHKLRLGIPLSILLFVVFLSRTTAFQNSPENLSLGILLDLLISCPVVYFLIIRKTKIPNFTVLYSFLIGILVATLIIPEENQDILSLIKLIVIPVIEIGILAMLVYKIRALKKSYVQKDENDFYDNILLASATVFPGRIGKVLATELAVFYYLFARNKVIENNDLHFTYFKKSGIKTVIGAFLFLISIETIVVHILVSQYNSRLAWILSFLGLYTMVQIFSIIKSMGKRLISINYNNESLKLNYGFGTQTIIPFSQIKKIEKNRKSISNDKLHVCLSLFDLIDSQNTIIYLNKENTLQKIYGIEKNYKSISLFIDERDAFVDKIQEIIQTKNI